MPLRAACAIAVRATCALHVRGIFALLVLAAVAAGPACAARLSPQEIAQACANADGAAHCGRLIESMQLARLPGLARRDGRTLTVNLYPEGSASFVDREEPPDARSYSLWDSLDRINAVLIYTIGDDGTTFILLSRRTNRRFTLPSEPVLSPDRQRLVTADVCPTQCGNEIAVWRFDGDALVKELAWKPPQGWMDAAAAWKDADTLQIDYTTSAQADQKLERKLGDAAWTRVAAPR
jgi:hypothetical protein